MGLEQLQVPSWIVSLYDKGIASQVSLKDRLASGGLCTMFEPTAIITEQYSHTEKRLSKLLYMKAERAVPIRIQFQLTR